MSIIKKHIDFFEQYIDESTIVDGEQLFDQQEDIPVSLQEKDWQATLFESGHQISVNIFIENYVIRSFACSFCKTTSKIPCKHIIAALFEIRKLIDNQQQKVRNSPKSGKKIKLEQFISNLSYEDLSKFIKFYYRKDKKFAIHLKARFFRVLYPDPLYNDYLDFLNEIIGPVTGKPKNLNSSKLRLYTSVVNEFTSQIDDSISLGQYTGAFHLTYALIEKACYLYAHSGIYTEKLKKQQTLLHDKLNELLKCDLAPELRTKIVEKSLQLVSKSFYRLIDSEKNLFEIVLPHLLQSDENLKLIQIIENKLSLSDTNSNEVLYLMAFHMSITGIEDQIMNKLFTRFRPDQLLKFVKYLIEQNDFKSAEAVLLQLMRHQSFQNRSFEDTLLKVYRRSGQYEKFVSRGVEFYMNRKDHLLIRQILDAETNSKFELESMISSNSELCSKPDKLTAFYYYSNQNEKLIQALEKESTLAIIMQFDDHLFTTYEERLSDLYSCKLLEHFKRHAGPISINPYHRVISHLNIHNQHNIIHSIRKSLKKTFAHRRSLITKL